MWKLIGESYSWSAAIRFQTKLSKSPTYKQIAEMGSVGELIRKLHKAYQSARDRFLRTASARLPNCTT